MGNDWKWTPFDEVVDINPRVVLERGEDYPFVSMDAVEANVRDVKAKESRRYSGGGAKFAAGDVLMARITPSLEHGKISRYLSTAMTDVGHGSTEFIVIRGKDNISETAFAYYLTRWQEFHSFAVSQMTGSSGRQRVPTESLHHILVPVPPLTEQRTIAHILGSLDDKIEMNRRMNETLEGIARALFKSWFVDFDPVRAKVEGSDTGLPLDIADLFPDSLEESEMGLIPTGWKVVSYTEVVDVISGGTPKTSMDSYWNGDIPWFSVVDTPSKSQLFVIDTQKHVTQLGISNSAAKVLPTGTTILTARGTVGNLAITAVPMAMNQSCYGLRRNAANQPAMTYYSAAFLVSSLRQWSHGSVFPTITTNTLRSMKTVEPPAALTAIFERICQPLLNRIKSSVLESRNLTSLRDTLLPKLISGELRVPDAEKLLLESPL